MMCVENVADKETKALFAPEVQIGNRIANACEARGVLVRPIAHLNVLSPPLILTRAQIDLLVSTLREGITEVLDDLTREGVWNG